jgi:hypothetical protein
MMIQKTNETKPPGDCSSSEQQACDTCVLLSAMWVAGQKEGVHPIHVPRAGMHKVMEWYTMDVHAPSMASAECARVHDVLAHIRRLRDIPLVMGVAEEACTRVPANNNNAWMSKCGACDAHPVAHATTWCLAAFGGHKDVMHAYI